MGGHGGGGPWGVTEEVVRGGSRRTWPVQVTEEMARGGHRGGGPWGVAEEAAPYRSRRWSVQVAEEVVRAGGGGGGPCRWRRWSVQVAEEVVRAGGGGGGPCRWRRRTHSEIQNLTGIFGFLSYENMVYRHKTEIACKILNS